MSDDDWVEIPTEKFRTRSIYKTFVHQDSVEIDEYGWGVVPISRHASKINQSFENLNYSAPITQTHILDEDGWIVINTPVFRSAREASYASLININASARSPLIS